MLTACNLRAPITGVGPLVTDIRGDLGLSPEAAGLLTTIPLIAFAAVSPMVSSLSRRMGAGNLMLAGLAVMGGGIIIRSVTGNAGVFVGTLAAGAGIAVGNVLLPAIVKTFFPGSIENVTSGYTALMQATSAVSTAVSVPLAGIVGWKGRPYDMACHCCGSYSGMRARKTHQSIGKGSGRRSSKKNREKPLQAQDDMVGNSLHGSPVICILFLHRVAAVCNAGQRIFPRPEAVICCQYTL